MVLRTHKTGTVTMAAATHSTTLADVTGKIKSISIKPSAATKFRISVTKAGVTEYLYGASAAKEVTTGGIVIYPVILRVNTDQGVLDTTANEYGEICVDSQDITIAASEGADGDTFAVEIVIEE